jgi:hypothetical protein
VKKWFTANDVDLIRAYPSSVLAEDPLTGTKLFEPCEDDWGFEQQLVQLGWMRSLGHEGGLFVTIGRRREAVAENETARTKRAATVT